MLRSCQCRREEILERRLPVSVLVGVGAIVVKVLDEVYVVSTYVIVVAASSSTWGAAPPWAAWESAFSFRYSLFPTIWSSRGDGVVDKWQLAVDIWSNTVHRRVVLPDVDVRVTVEVTTVVLCRSEVVKDTYLSEQLAVTVGPGKSAVTLRLDVIVVAGDLISALPHVMSATPRNILEAIGVVV